MADSESLALMSATWRQAPSAMAQGTEAIAAALWVGSEDAPQEVFAPAHPPHRWLMRRRFERACELLNDPRQSITDVAHLCGFASSQDLATVFRKRLGIAPAIYRRQRLP